MLVTINAIIFFVVLSPLWFLITIVKGFGVFLLYLAKSAIIIFAGLYGVITSYEGFKFYDFFNHLLISIIEMFSKPLATWDDIFPSFWDFGRWEHPLLAFFIWFACLFIGSLDR